MILKNNFVKYNFKKLGDIDISDWVKNLENVKESDWDSDSVRNRGKTHEKSSHLTNQMEI